MKTKNKRSRKLMRTRNRQRINTLRNQQIIIPPFMVLVLIKVSLESITTPAKMVLRLQLYVEKLTGNANFTIPVSTMTELEDLATDLAATIVAIDGGDLSKIPHRDSVMLQAANAIRKLSYDIQFQSNGNAEKIQSAGFEVKKGKGASQPVGDVLNMRAAPVGPGKVKLRWKRILRSRMNYVETTTDPVAGNWMPIGNTTKSTFVVEGLTPGTLAYYRVYGSNNLGDGNPGDPVEQRSL